jgi:hypothetical protein
MGKTASCDVCVELGWYEDSACDAFCPSLDSVCPKIDPTLVGHWRLDEESGRIAIDSSSFRNDGTYAGMPTPTAGKFGRALEFHGPASLHASSDRVILGDPANESLHFGTASFSYGFWVKMEATAGTFELPFSKGGESFDLTGFNVELGTGTWKACMSDGDESVCGVFNSAPLLRRWVHLMAVVDRPAGVLRLYVDGSPILPAKPIPTTFGSVSSSRPASIGAGADGRYAVRGLIDDVRIYNRALSDLEVYQLQQ